MTCCYCNDDRDEYYYCKTHDEIITHSEYKAAEKDWKRHKHTACETKGQIDYLSLEEVLSLIYNAVKKGRKT